MKSLIVFALIAMSVSYSQAQEGSSSMTFGKEEAQAVPRGFLPFIALGGGYTGYEKFQEAEGTPATVKLLGSWYLESPVVFDLGYGVNNQQFIHTSAANTGQTDGALEIAARWASSNRWQFGVVADQFFAQGPAYSADQGDAQFVGLQLLKEFNMTPSWLARLGARAQSLTNNTDGLVMMYLVDLQIGWNPGAYKTSAHQTAEMTPPKEEMVQEAMETPAAPAAPARPVAVQPAPIDELNYSAIAATGGAITFSSARANVTPQEQKRLNKIAKVLSENPDLVERVEVRGYADASGSEKTNERISQQRAVAVRNALQKSGLNDVDVVAVGKGASDSTGIKSQDRRAELVFIGVKDENALRKALSDIQ